MEKLNIFGSNYEEEEDEMVSNEESKAALRELLNVIDEVDSVEIMNFKQRKAFVYFDPYNPDESVTYAHLKYEDE